MAEGALWENVALRFVDRDVDLDIDHQTAFFMGCDYWRFASRSLLAMVVETALD